MAINDPNELDNPFGGRRPSYNFSRGGASIRGFRSRPGAPLHDPTTDAPMSSTYRPTNWDAVFRPRGNPAAGAAPSVLRDAAGGTNHSEMWSMPPISRGWNTTNQAQARSIFDRYKTNRGPDAIALDGFEDEASRFDGPTTAQNPFGWGSAFT